MTGEIVINALKAHHAKRIATAWLRVPSQKFLEFLMNAGWYSARSCIMHPRPHDISNELLVKICEDYADFVAARRTKTLVSETRSSTSI